MTNQAKSILKRLSPDLFHVLSSLRFFAFCRNKFGEFQAKFQNSVYEDRQITVLSGPFQGLRYYNRIVWGPLTPKWIGSYEEELHAIIGLIVTRDYPVIIDVGAAEGYYAIGLAARCPKTSVITFDVDPIARRRQRQLADLNGVQNLEIRKYCSHRSLIDLAPPGSLLICDVEGFELVLIDPDLAPALEHVDLLVEIHAFESTPATEVRDRIIERFRDTHTIERHVQTPRDPAKYQASCPALTSIDRESLAFALDEFRPVPSEWLWMQNGASNGKTSPTD